MRGDTIKVGIGFATGRKYFQKVLRSYIFNWKESGLVDDINVSLNLFVAYDLSYNNTKKTDYTRVSADIAKYIDSKHFIGAEEVDDAKNYLIDNGVLTRRESAMLFGKGYASQRNIVLYSAMKNGMDYLLFLDDDEYPVAVTNTASTAVWGGQHVLKTHLENIKAADITYGYHCGYISPIPYVEFNDTLKENEFRMFIESISNDIVSWDKTKQVMQNGGVSYADTDVLTKKQVYEVPEENNAKFISGSNLCINLTDARKVLPFYNPPGARGEDTFLSTCLRDRKVLRIPCYAFHDGFSTYNHLLAGVLPTKLNFIKPDSEKVVKRFYRACVGWIRYKPLLVYITNREGYKDTIIRMHRNLDETLPSICEFFGTRDFFNIKKELEKFDKNVIINYADFTEVKDLWSRVMGFLNNR